MKVSKPINWLSKRLFQPDKLGNPVQLEICGYIEEEGDKGKNRRLSGKYKDGKIYEFDIYGDAVGVLVDNIGDDSDLWNGRKIMVSLVMSNGKELKNIRVLP